MILAVHTINLFWKVSLKGFFLHIFSDTDIQDTMTNPESQTPEVSFNL